MRTRFASSNIIILLALLTVASCTDTPSTAFAGDKPDLLTYPPRDTYERQLQDYQRHGYDSQRNGALSQESNIQRENREREQANRYGYQDNPANNTWGNSGGYRRDGAGGQYGGQCLYGC